MAVYAVFACVTGAAYIGVLAWWCCVRRREGRKKDGGGVRLEEHEL